MAKRSASKTLSPENVDDIGRAAARLHRLLKELGHVRGLEQSAATMPDARDRLSFIDQTMHEASEKTISAVEAALPLTVISRNHCADIVGQLSADTALSSNAQVLQAISRLGEMAAAQEALHHHLLLIMEAQEFRDVAGQMVNKILEAAVEIEKILLDILRVYAPDSKDSLIKQEGLTAGPAFRSGSDDVKGQDEVDDLLASMGF